MHISSKEVRSAAQNWQAWQADFEHYAKTRSFSKLPVLRDPKRWRCFLHEYSLNRTIKKGGQEILRVALQRDTVFRRGITTGKAVDIDDTIRRFRKYGAADGSRRPISLISKVAAFARPDKFMAWDTYARKGVNIQRGYRENRAIPDYQTYMVEVSAVLRREAIDLRAAMHTWPGPRSRERQLRVLDVVLMNLGGRKHTSKKIGCV